MMNIFCTENLASSPLIQEGRARLHVELGFPSASLAYLSGLEKCTEQIVVFAHQDVYLPAGWEKGLEQAIETLNSRGEKWGY